MIRGTLFNTRNSCLRMPFMQWISAEPDSPFINQPIFGTHGLVEYYPGTTNLIISVPHGGEMKPPFLPDRVKVPVEVTDDELKTNKETQDDDTNHRITTAADIFTQEIAKIMVKEYNIITGQKPYLIMANLHRSKLDPNRPILQAAQGNGVCELVYKEYHEFIRIAKKEVPVPGLVIDLHGQNHHQNSIEIGYLFKKSELNNLDYMSTVPSIKNLLERTKISTPEMLYGDKSLGSLFEGAGYNAVPSPRQHYPGKDKYYKGGYITQTHGSSEEGGIDAIQLELPAEIRHEGGEGQREAFSKDLAKILAKFIELYY
eukprot:GFUD01029321.1.p1 GENE.GFUD01029321.1~~GFUD01029321.1.p1  ORF type:complete len:315 (+),score=54.52 GFUD01029321.1:304-1248(+)